jgi:ubiquinone biosynthesis protein Coq4
MSVILSIEEAKAQGLTKLVEQLERDKERRELLKMKPLESVKVEMEVEDLRQDIADFEDLY